MYKDDAAVRPCARPYGAFELWACCVSALPHTATQLTTHNPHRNRKREAGVCSVRVLAVLVLHEGVERLGELGPAPRSRVGVLG